MALDDNDRKEIRELFASILGGDDFKKELGKTIEGQVGKALKAIDIDGKIAALDLDNKLETIKTELKPKDPPKPEPKPGDKGAPAGSVTDDPEFKKLQVELAKLTEQNKAAAKRAEEAESARKAELLANALRDALTAAGADAKRVPIALDRLRSLGIVKLDDKGAPSFVFKREWGDELVPAAEGAKEWLGTDEGKFFVPASGKQGTGDRTGETAPPPRKDGKVDWGALGSSLNLSVLESLSD